MTTSATTADLRVKHRAAAKLHVLIVPSWYPSEDQPVRGIFFRDQALALSSAGIQTGVVFVEQRTLRLLSLRALQRYHWQLSTQNVDGVNELRRHSWLLRPREAFRQLWVRSMIRLGREYTRRYGRPDVFHVHSSVSAGEAADELSAELGIPFVITEHRSLFLQSGWSPPSPERTRAALRSAGAVTAVSQRLARAVECFAPGITCGILPNVVNTDFFGTAACVPRPAHEFRILTACGLTRLKGVDSLIRAFAQAFPDDATARLVIAGDGPEKAALRALARKCAVCARVDFLGLLDRNRLREEMARASVFALASHVETFGVAIIEALAAGLPIVATRCGGPDDIVTEDVGWLVDPGDDTSLTARLRVARARMTSMDRRAIAAFARTRYGRASFIARIRELYAGIC